MDYAASTITTTCISRKGETPVNETARPLVGHVVGEYTTGVAGADSAATFAPAFGYVMIRATADYLPHPTATPPFTMFPRPVKAIIDNGSLSLSTPGSAGVPLLATENPDGSVKGWQWEATVTFTDGRGGKVIGTLPPSRFPLAPGETVDLTKVVKVPAAPLVGIPQQPDGQPGKDGQPGPGASPDLLYTPLPYRGPMGIFRAGLTLAKTAGRPLAIAFAGSSTTAGNNTALAKRWVTLVAARLTSNPVLTDTEANNRKGNLPAGINVVNAGLNGATSTTYLADGRDARVASANPRLVVHTIGSNDYGSNRAPATYKASILDAIDRINALVPGPVAHLLIHSYERYDVTPRTYAWSQYRDALVGIATERPETVAFLDLSATFRSLGIPSTDPLGLMQTDKLHMNDYGHALYADLVASALGITAASDTSAPVIPVVPETPAATVVMADDFTRANGPLGVTSVGSKPWLYSAGTMSLVGGLVTASAGNAGAVADAGITDCTVGADGFLASQGLLFRCNADGSGYYFMWSGGGQEYRVGKRSALGAFTALVGTGTANSFVAGGIYEVELRGSLIRCKVGGVTVLEVTDTTYTGSWYGIVSASTTGIPLKNFRVTAPSGN